jgi:hypothetical protein
MKKQQLNKSSSALTRAVKVPINSERESNLFYAKANIKTKPGNCSPILYKSKTPTKTTPLTFKNNSTHSEYKPSSTPTGKENSLRYPQILERAVKRTVRGDYASITNEKHGSVGYEVLEVQ